MDRIEQDIVRVETRVQTFIVALKAQRTTLLATRCTDERMYDSENLPKLQVLSMFGGTLAVLSNKRRPPASTFRELVTLLKQLEFVAGVSQALPRYPAFEGLLDRLVAVLPRAIEYANGTTVRLSAEDLRFAQEEG